MREDIAARSTKKEIQERFQRLRERIEDIRDQFAAQTIAAKQAMRKEVTDKATDKDLQFLRDEKADKDYVNDLLDRLERIEEIVNDEEGAEQEDDSFENASSEDRDAINDLIGNSIDNEADSKKKLTMVEEDNENIDFERGSSSDKNKTSSGI